MFCFKVVVSESVLKPYTGILQPAFTGNQRLLVSTSIGIPFSPKPRKINLIKTLVHRALMICSKTKLDSELDTIRQLLMDNGYPEDVLVSCIKKFFSGAISKIGILEHG